jgi:hypothetical protein
VDKETIQQIAAEVVTRLPYGDSFWLFLLVNAAVMALVGALAALGVSYFRTRGQNLATKHDFEELQRQLKANTDWSRPSKQRWGRRIGLSGSGRTSVGLSSKHSWKRCTTAKCI